MSNFKRLTSTSNAKIIAVNMDAVAYIHPAQHGSTIYFVGASADGKLANIPVKESIADIGAVSSAARTDSELAGEPISS
jgi:hypothetical protein